MTLDEDCRVALAEITFPSGFNIVKTKEYFPYTPRRAKETLSNLTPSADVFFRRPNFSSKAIYLDGEIESIEIILEILKKGTVFNKSLLEASCI